MADHHPLLLDDPWTVDPQGFPSHGGPTDKLLFLLNYAVLAPSILNTQPWRFRIMANKVELFADRTRLLPVTDPKGRELTISCGAALLNLRLAIRGFGYTYEMEVFPDTALPDLLARVILTSSQTPSDSDRQLRDAISLRRTNRRELLDQPLPVGLLKDLSAAAHSEGAALKATHAQAAKRLIAELVAEAEKSLLDDPKYRQELGDWIGQRIGEATAREGEPHGSMAGHTPTRPAQPSLLTPSVASTVRMFSRGEEALGRLRRHLAAAPVVALLSTDDDAPRSWIAAGQALQRALLVATAAGAYASFLNPPIEVPILRPKLAPIFGITAMPQVLLRFGYAGEIPPEARRPTYDVVG